MTRDIELIKAAASIWPLWIIVAACLYRAAYVAILLWRGRK